MDFRLKSLNPCTLHGFLQALRPYNEGTLVTADLNEEKMHMMVYKYIGDDVESIKQATVI